MDKAHEWDPFWSDDRVMPVSYSCVNPQLNILKENEVENDYLLSSELGLLDCGTPSTTVTNTITHEGNEERGKLEFSLEEAWFLSSQLDVNDKENTASKTILPHIPITLGFQTARGKVLAPPSEEALLKAQTLLSPSTNDESDYEEC